MSSSTHFINNFGSVFCIVFLLVIGIEESLDLESVFDLLEHVAVIFELVFFWIKYGRCISNVAFCY